MAVLCIFLAIACVFDYGKGRIPNGLAALAGAAGAAGSFLETGPGGIPGYLARAGGIMLLMYPFFRIGVLGAGDVKLFGVAAGYYPIDKIFSFLFFSMLIAAIFSVIRVVRERNARERLQYFCEYCGDVIRSGNWRLYFGETDAKFTGICLSGPVLFSTLLYWGGVY